MTKKADTWMPLYVGEYLADTTNLNTEQHGAYCLMLMAAWRRGGTLPLDDGQLSSITKLQMSRWRLHKPVLLELFKQEGDVLRHKRVTEERLKAQAISDKKAINGKKGAANRWLEDGESDGNAMANAIAKPMANASQTDAPTRVFLPSPSHVPSEQGEEAVASLSPAGPAPELFDLPPDVQDAETGIPPCPQRRLVTLFAERVPELPKPRLELWESSAGSAAMRQRWKWLLRARRESGERYAETLEDGVEWFGRFFDTVHESDFLSGRSGKWAKCNLSWLMERENFNKVVQGNYINR